jgi:hypothetical protein
MGMFLIFLIGKRCSTRDPLSPYLFILVLELLSAAIKNDPEIFQKSSMTNVYLEGAVHGNSALSQAILLRSCQN